MKHKRVFALLFATALILNGCAPLENDPLDISITMLAGGATWDFTVNPDGALTVNMDRMIFKEGKLTGDDRKKECVQLDHKTILELKRLLRKAYRDREKTNTWGIIGGSDIFFSANGEEYPAFPYGLSANQYLNKVIDILVAKSPVAFVDREGYPIEYTVKGTGD